MLIEEMFGPIISEVEEVQGANLTAEFRLVRIADVFPDQNQPRKFFDQSAMTELIESVKKNGVLQPIMVRTSGKTRINLSRIPSTPSPRNGFKDHDIVQEDGGPLYNLVCGERRYRAAEAAGMTEIPAVIRTLTDAEALEIQIIENLQRKDVHPMEEAVAFKSLREQQRFEIEEISARIGKSANYVAQRIKLNDLIEEFQEMLFHNKMNLTQALKLCRVNGHDQKEIFKEAVQYNKDWKTDKRFELRSIDHYVERSQLDLSKAPFKTNDPLLYPEMGPCNKCPYNTANNQLLFPELNKKRFCTNSVCYNIKCDRNYQATIKKAMQDPEVLLINSSSYLDKKEKDKIKAAEEIGAVVLNNDLFEIVGAPDHPGSLDEYKKENYDDEAGSQEEIISAYNEEIGRYDENLNEYKQAIADGTVRKAFVVVGGWGAKEGSMVEIKIKPKKGATIDTSGTASEISANIQVEIEIAAIKEREARNKELDREKVFKQAMEQLSETFTASASNTLTPNEWKALAILLVETSYKARDFIDKELHIGNDYNRFQVYKKLSHDSATICRIVRIALFDKLVNVNTEADFGKNGKAAIMMDLAKQYIPEELKQFESEQKKKADKRKSNVQKRLSALQSAPEEVAS